MPRQGALEDIHAAPRQQLKSNQEEEEMRRRINRGMSNRRRHHDHLLGAERTPHRLETTPPHLELGARARGMKDL